MDEPLKFATRDEFRAWLQANGESSSGVWLLFGKPGGPSTLKAGEALEEALCFGWIDGQMRRIDEGSYRKYFAPRRKDSAWSDKTRRSPRSSSGAARWPIPAEGRWKSPRKTAAGTLRRHRTSPRSTSRPWSRCSKATSRLMRTTWPCPLR
ncbi:MAG: YdeI/OmpD-associated family protein [Eggerthellaceae bacterium]